MISCYSTFDNQVFCFIDLKVVMRIILPSMGRHFLKKVSYSVTVGIKPHALYGAKI